MQKPICFKPIGSIRMWICRVDLISLPKGMYTRASSISSIRHSITKFALRTSVALHCAELFAYLWHQQRTNSVCHSPLTNNGCSWLKWIDLRRNVSKFEAFRSEWFSLNPLHFIAVAPGINDIIRRSDESSVTTPFETMFEPDKLRERADAKTALFCSCGWPQHMLIPRGTENGKSFTLFAIVSNLDEDEVGKSISNSDTWPVPI